MARETGVQSQVESYQRLKKWYLMPPCLTLSIIRYVSRVKWSNPGKGVAPSPHLSVVGIEKGAFGSPSTMVANFSYFFKNILIYVFLANLSKNKKCGSYKFNQTFVGYQDGGFCSWVCFLLFFFFFFNFLFVCFVFFLFLEDCFLVVSVFVCFCWFVCFVCFLSFF